jgi:5-methylcytosine-specific restriction enzyme subunit McrC
MATSTLPSEGRIGRIPVRNLWLLMLYASDLVRFGGEVKALVDQNIDDLPDLLARLLVNSVERRLRRNLTRGYRHRSAVLKRVRGRIDILTTESRQLLSRGEICCRFEELTIDTPRNRLVRAALDLLTRMVSKRDVAHQCRTLAYNLVKAGVGAAPPSRAELASDQIGRNDATDRLMVALARLAFDLALPTEEAGSKALVAPEREEIWVRRLFEKAVLGFSRIELESIGWNVRGSTPLEWQITSATIGLAAILPRMQTDIILHPPLGRRLVVDTKFASITTSGRFRQTSLKSGYIYQMYAYLRSQEGRDPRWSDASGLFLHPAINENVREQVEIQNHRISFSTVDLAGTATGIRNELRVLLLDGIEGSGAQVAVRSLALSGFGRA